MCAHTHNLIHGQKSTSTSEVQGFFPHATSSKTKKMFLELMCPSSRVEYIIIASIHAHDQAKSYLPIGN